MNAKGREVVELNSVLVIENFTSLCIVQYIYYVYLNKSCVDHFDLVNTLDQVFTLAKNRTSAGGHLCIKVHACTQTHM